MSIINFFSFWFSNWFYGRFWSYYAPIEIFLPLKQLEQQEQHKNKSRYPKITNCRYLTGQLSLPQNKLSLYPSDCRWCKSDWSKITWYRLHDIEALDYPLSVLDGGYIYTHLNMEGQNISKVRVHMQFANQGGILTSSEYSSLWTKGVIRSVTQD